QGFESHTLAHETTHAVVARIYKNRHWPLCLNEGFPDYKAECCGAVRRGLQPGAYPRNLPWASMTLSELIATRQYPREGAAVTELYESSTKFVRYLFTKYPPEVFPKFIDRVIDGEAVQSALVELYSDEFRDLAAFDKRFQTSIR